MKNHLKRFARACLGGAWAFGLCFGAISASTLAAELPEIVTFYDGDTVKIRDTNATYKLRITDIDAPERNQQYGKTARRALIKLCKRADIQVQLTGVDRYQRKLGKLSCNQQDVSHFMVQEGHAWFNARYTNDGVLAQAQQAARTQGLGLWRNQHPTPPWQWRKNHPYHRSN